MPQTQQEIAASQNLPKDESFSSQIEPEVGSWEPYLSLVQGWQRADEICAKTIERAATTRKEEETRAQTTFKTEKTRLETAGKESVGALEVERKAAKESADRLLGQVNTIQRRVRQDMATIGLQRLVDGIEIPAFGTGERADPATTLSSLRDITERTIAIEKSLQDDMFSLRAARQRQSAQMWAVGIGLWIVAAVVFAPHAWIEAFLVAVAVFVMGTPRKIDNREELRPSFASHLGHCISLLFGKRQVMQHPFSLFENGRAISGNVVGGSVVAACVSLIVFMSETGVGYSWDNLLTHMTFVLVISIISGAITFAVENKDLTLTELNEGSRNKISR